MSIHSHSLASLFIHLTIINVNSLFMEAACGASCRLDSLSSSPLSTSVRRLDCVGGIWDAFASRLFALVRMVINIKIVARRRAYLSENVLLFLLAPSIDAAKTEKAQTTHEMQCGSERKKNPNGSDTVRFL
jgi:hypothetical protein